MLAPLREVAGPEGIIQVHVPFSLADLSSIEKRLGSFSANPTQFIKEFRYLSQAYDLTWHDIHIILTCTMTADERDRVQAAARDYADRAHIADATTVTGVEAVPLVNPHWGYLDGREEETPRLHAPMPYRRHGKGGSEGS